MKIINNIKKILRKNKITACLLALSISSFLIGNCFDWISLKAIGCVGLSIIIGKIISKFFNEILNYYIKKDFIKLNFLLFTYFFSFLELFKDIKNLHFFNIIEEPFLIILLSTTIGCFLSLRDLLINTNLKLSTINSENLEENSLEYYEMQSKNFKATQLEVENSELVFSKLFKKD